MPLPLIVALGAVAISGFAATAGVVTTVEKIIRQKIFSNLQKKYSLSPKKIWSIIVFQLKSALKNWVKPNC